VPAQAMRWRICALAQDRLMAARAAMTDPCAAVSRALASEAN
jgi:hypothetical protein